MRAAVLALVLPALARQRGPADEAFNELDTDGNGSLDLGELTSFLTSRGHNEKEVQTTADLLDTGGKDGVISREEWRTGFYSGVDFSDSLSSNRRKLSHLFWHFYPSPPPVPPPPSPPPVPPPPSPPPPSPPPSPPPPSPPPSFPPPPSLPPSPSPPPPDPPPSPEPRPPNTPPPPPFPPVVPGALLTGIVSTDFRVLGETATFNVTDFKVELFRLFPNSDEIEIIMSRISGTTVNLRTTIVTENPHHAEPIAHRIRETAPAVMTIDWFSNVYKVQDIIGMTETTLDGCATPNDCVLRFPPPNPDPPPAPSPHPSPPPLPPPVPPNVPPPPPSTPPEDITIILAAGGGGGGVVLVIAVVCLWRICKARRKRLKESGTKIVAPAKDAPAEKKVSEKKGAKV